MTYTNSSGILTITKRIGYRKSYRNTKGGKEIGTGLDNNSYSHQSSQLVHKSKTKITTTTTTTNTLSNDDNNYNSDDTVNEQHKKQKS